MIAPLAVNPGDISEAQRLQRQQDTEYLVGQLLGCSIVNASEISQRKHLRLRYRKLFRDAIVGPLTTNFECFLPEVVSHPEARLIMDRMISEAWEVVHRDLPGREISKEEVYSWLQVRIPSRHIHWMAFHALLGMETGIEHIDGWLIRRARKYKLSLPVHQEMMNIVIAKTEENRNMLDKQKLEQSKQASAKKGSGAPVMGAEDHVRKTREGS